MKRHLLGSIIIALLAGCPLCASAGSFTIDGLKYSTLTDSTVTVAKYVDGKDIVIPAKVTDDGKEYTVTEITRQSFYNADITTLTLPSTVTTIGEYAFWKARMQTVTFSEGLESIGYAAFKACPNLTEIKLPSSLKVLGEVSSLIGFGGSVFAECSSLISVEIPGNVTEVTELCFANCPNLKNVTLEEGITSFGERVFENCTALHTLEFPSTVEALDRAVLNGTGIREITFPGSISAIPNSCCLWCGNLTKITFEEGVEEIGKQSFADCGSMTELNIPNSVEWIRSDAFQGNPMVKTIRIGKGIRRMGHCALAVWEPDGANQPHWDLTDIFIESTVPPVHEQNDDHLTELPDDFFFGDSKAFTEEYIEQFHSTVTLHVPDDAIETYRTAPVWGKFKNIVGIGSAISAIPADFTDAPKEVFAIDGTPVATGNVDLSTLPAGIYVVRSCGRTVKTLIR